MEVYCVQVKGKQETINVAADSMKHDDSDPYAPWRFYRGDELVAEINDVTAWWVLPPPAGPRVY